MAAVLGVGGFILPISNGDGVSHSYSSKPPHGGMATQTGIQAAITDSRDVFDYTMESVRTGAADNPFSDVDLAVLDGSVTRAGDIRSSPSWVLESGESRVVATWKSLVTPVVARDLPPNARGTSVSSSVLIFADAVTITLNGRQVAGRPYIQKSWRRVTGPDGPASARWFALAETYTRQPTG